MTRLETIYFAALACLALTTLPASVPAQGSSSSNAGNFGGGSTLSVNPRTGAVSLEAELFKIHGIREEISAELTLTYGSDQGVSDSDANTNVFGLPFGWSLNLSHIANKNTYQEVNMGGTQTYVFDDRWRTEFTPIGQTQSTPVLTGLKQYNRTDTNLRQDSSTGVTVGNIPAEYVLSTLAGQTQYLSGGGLLLQETDRFGNSIQYFYNGNFTPDRARVMQIKDTWDNEINFDYSVPGTVTIVLPDGRTVGWVFSNEVTEIIDAQGKVTHLRWANACGLYSVLTGVTSAGGGAMTIDYACMDVCTQLTFPSNCSNASKGWPVAATRYDCASNPSGARCPTGSAQDYLTTTFDIGGTPGSSSINNYTGYPFYSPYASKDPAADALMESNDTSFLYTTEVQRRDASGIVQYQTEHDYDFVHLEVESRVRVRSSTTGGLSLAKQTSTCYGLPGTNNPGCQTSGAIDYTQLPANYQQATRTGSCVYAVDGEQNPEARLSILDRAYDGFGNVINRKAYHGTTTTGVVQSCNDRITRLDPSALQVVLDVYLQYDTPTSIVGSYLELGSGAGHYGLLTAAQSFTYLDVDDAP